MSRGYGKVQRAVLAWLSADDTDDWFSVRQLARELGVTRQSCSRAVHRLKDEGVVEQAITPDLVLSVHRIREDPEHPQARVVRDVAFVRIALSDTVRARRRLDREQGRRIAFDAQRLAKMILDRMEGVRNTQWAGQLYREPLREVAREAEALQQPRSSPPWVERSFNELDDALTRYRQWRKRPRSLS